MQIDNTDPVDDTTTPAGWQHSVTDITIQGTDVDSGVGHVEWELDGVRGTGPNGHVVPIGHGIHELKTRIIDAVGNATGWVTHPQIQVDIAGPVDTTTGPGRLGDRRRRGHGQRHRHRLVGRRRRTTEWKLKNDATGNVQTGSGGAGPVPVLVSGDGVHELKTRLTDGVGDNSGWRTQYVRIDTVTPTDTTNPVTGWVKQALNVTVTGNDVHSDIARVEWKLNGTPATSSAARGWSRSAPAASTRSRRASSTRPATRAPGRRTRSGSTCCCRRTSRRPRRRSGSRTPYSVTLTGSDIDSGIDVMRWRVDYDRRSSRCDGAEGQPGAAQATVDAATGTHTLYTWAVDRVGNASAGARGDGPHRPRPSDRRDGVSGRRGPARSQDHVRSRRRPFGRRRARVDVERGRGARRPRR